MRVSHFAARSLLTIARSGVSASPQLDTSVSAHNDHHPQLRILLTDGQYRTLTPIPFGSEPNILALLNRKIGRWLPGYNWNLQPVVFSSTGSQLTKLVKGIS